MITTKHGQQAIIVSNLMRDLAKELQSVIDQMDSPSSDKPLSQLIDRHNSISRVLAGLLCDEIKQGESM